MSFFDEAIEQYEEEHVPPGQRLDFWKWSPEKDEHAIKVMALIGVGIISHKTAFQLIGLTA